MEYLTITESQQLVAEGTAMIVLDNGFSGGENPNLIANGFAGYVAVRV
jgi:hypothetical protein